MFDKWVSEEDVLDNNQINKSEIEIVMPKSDVTIKACFAKKTNVEKVTEKKKANDGRIKSNNGNKTDKRKSSKNNKSEKKDVVKAKHRGSDKKKIEKNNIKDNNKNEKKKSEDSKYQNDTNESTPKTGDYMNKDLIRMLLLIQSMSLIMVCVLLKKKEKDCANDK